MHHELLIRGGTVIDGSKAPRFDADIAVDGGRITAIGTLERHTADTVLDATGRIVAPGFIDSHTHDDQAALVQPDMVFKVSQGVTTVIAGNCGISAAPQPVHLEHMVRTRNVVWPTSDATLTAAGVRSSCSK